MQERLVQPMQAVGGNHYDGMDAMREQAAGKWYVDYYMLSIILTEEAPYNGWV